MLSSVKFCYHFGHRRQLALAQLVPVDCLLLSKRTNWMAWPEKEKGITFKEKNLQKNSPQRPKNN